MHQGNGHMKSYMKLIRACTQLSLRVCHCFSLALVLAAIGVQDRVLLVHMDNPEVPSTSLYCTLADLGITVLRLHSDPESVSESELAFHWWIG